MPMTTRAIAVKRVRALNTTSRALAYERRRSLPHHLQTWPGAQEGGFISSSFIDGLLPDEFYFHAMGSRKNLVDTACGTSVTGYFQRRIIKCLEDLTVAYDLSVRNCNNIIIQR